MRPLQILHVTESLGHGGAEQNLLSLVRRLPPDRYQHHLAWLYGEDRLLEAFRPHVASLIPLGAVGRGGLAVASARLATWVRRNRPSVVHAQLIRAEYVARAAALVGRVPVVTTWQNVFYEDAALPDFGNSRLRRDVARWVDRATGRREHKFIAVSRYVAERMAQELRISPQRVVVIPNAVEPARYEPVPDDEKARVRASLGLREGTRVLLAVGRLVAQKGHEDAIEAMLHLRPSSPDTVLLIAGAGPRKNELEALVRARGLEQQVRVLGPRPDVPAMLQLADLFVFPSRYEGLSVALVEAVANGLPAVVSDIPQNREVADGIPSVTFVPCGQPTAWAEAIRSSLGQIGSLRRAADDAQERVRAQFSPVRLAAEVAAVLSAAAAS